MPCCFLTFKPTDFPHADGQGRREPLRLDTITLDMSHIAQTDDASVQNTNDFAAAIAGVGLSSFVDLKKLVIVLPSQKIVESILANDTWRDVTTSLVQCECRVVIPIDRKRNPLWVSNALETSDTAGPGQTVRRHAIWLMN